MPTPLNEGWTALVGAVTGGAGLKLVELWLSRRKMSVDESTAIRKELRDENKDLRDKLDRALSDRDAWREKYFAGREELAALREKLATCDCPDENPSPRPDAEPHPPDPDG
jgi:hypothetical protein